MTYSSFALIFWISCGLIIRHELTVGKFVNVLFESVLTAVSVDRFMELSSVLG